MQAASSAAVASLFLAEMAITTDLRYEGKSGTSLVVGIFFVAVPHIAFYFLLAKSLRAQLLNWAFYRSNRIFKLLTCGLTSQVKFGKKNLDTSIMNG